MDLDMLTNTELENLSKELIDKFDNEKKKIIESYKNMEKYHMDYEEVNKLLNKRNGKR